MKSERNLIYSQPESYHFSEDSILLAELASRNFNRKEMRILDIGAGCGVVGIEFIKKSTPKPAEVIFIEPQEVFKEHLSRNLESMSDGVVTKVCHSKVQEFEEGTFDLILSNPPFYDPKRGRLSDNIVQNECRFSHNLTPRELCLSLAKLLKPTGEAWILVGNGKEQNHSVEDFSHPDLKSEKIEKGIWLFLRFIKLNKE